MPETQASDLAARLFKLRFPGRDPRKGELRRYESLPVEELREMLNALERASASVASRREASAGLSEARATARATQDRALAGLDAVADRITARRLRERVVSASAVSEASSASSTAIEEHLKSALKALTVNQGQHSILDALQVRVALDEATSPWRRSGADELFDLIIGRADGNLINVLQVKAGSGRAEALKVAAVERYLEYELQKTSWGVVRLLDRKLVELAGRDQATRRLLSDHVLRSSVFEPSFLTDPLPILTATAATESLAKLYLFGKEFRPTKVISIGGGGEMIGEFVRTELRLAEGRSRHWNAKANALRQLTEDLLDDDRVLVVSDVANSERDLAKLREVFGDRLPSASLAFAALAGNAKTYEAMRSDSVVYFANLTAQVDAKLPWARTGSYRRTSQSHFFGHSTPSPLRIAKDFFASVTNGLMALVR